MGWFISALLVLVTNVMGSILSHQPAKRTSPASLGDLNIPTTAEGRPIPLVYGTCLLESPLVGWYGDFSATPHVHSTHHWLTGWENEPYGYKYWLGMQLVLCMGVIDKVLQVRFDDDAPTLVTRTETDDYTDLDFDAPDLYGGADPPSGEGGIVGNIRIYHGTTTQDPDEYLDGLIGWEWAAPNPGVPAYRGIAYAVVGRPFYIGMSPYMRSISFVVQRCPNGPGFSSGEENIDGDANPAAMIYDLLTAPAGDSDMPQYGLGIPESLIDTESFLEAGQTLSDEGLGLSMTFDTLQTGKEAIGSILDHIDAVMYREPTTGLLTLKLIRKDYVESELPVLDESNCDLEEFSRPAMSALRNLIRVEYIERGEVPEQGLGNS